MRKYAKVSRSRIIEIINQNKLFFCMVCVQAVVCVVLLASCFFEKKEYFISVPQLSAEDIREGVSVEYGDSNLQIENNTGKVIVMTFCSEPQKIATGTYNLTVEYISQKTSESPTYNVKDSTAYCGLRSSSNPGAVEMDELVLDDGHFSVSGRVKISAGSLADDVQFYVTYNGEGSLQLYYVSLTELIAGRWIRLFVFLCLFAVVDFIWVMLFGNGTSVEAEEFFKNKKILIGILGITCVSCLPYIGDFFYQCYNDIGFHMQRISAVAQELANHQFPVRMDTEMLNGYGYPSSLYYCDIFLYIPAVLYLLTVPLYRCYQVYLLLISFGTAAVSYCTFKGITKERAISLMGAALYTLSLHRLIWVLDAGVGMYTAMMFLPLVVYGLWKIYTSDKPVLGDYIPLAFGMAGIIQSHVLTVIMVIPFIVFICLLNWRKSLELSRIAAFIKAVAVTVGLSLWFIVPFLSSMLANDIKASTIVDEIQSKGNTLFQLFVKWDVSSGASNSTLGLPYLLGGGIVLHCLLKRRDWEEKYSSLHKTMKYCVVLAIAALLMTTEYFPWDYMGSMFGKIASFVVRQLQFPGRYLSIALVFLSVAIVIALAILKKENIGIYTKSMCFLRISLILTTVIFYWITFEGEKVDMVSASNSETMSIAASEYILDNTDTSALSVALPEADSSILLNKYEKVSGIAYLTCSNEGEEEAAVIFPILNYANYKAYDLESGDGYNIETGDNNRIEVMVEPGYSGTLCVKYVPPKLWRISEIISLFTVIALCMRLIIERKASSER